MSIREGMSWVVAGMFAVGMMFGRRECNGGQAGKLCSAWQEAARLDTLAATSTAHGVCYCSL